MSPTSTLQRTAGTSLQACRARILATYDRATREQRWQGRSWYPNGAALIRDMAADTGHTVPAVTAAMAHLSPRSRWSRNVAACSVLCTTGDRLPGTLTRSYDNARAALTHPDPMSTLTTDKVRAFAANLSGDHEPVTVDVWAARVALGDRADESVLKRVGVYDAIAAAYVSAARARGVSPATMQATTWVVVRGDHR